MTYLEVLQGSAALNYPIEESAYRAALEKNGVNPDDEFILSDDSSKAVDLAISDLALTLIFSVKKLMDDGYTVELQSVADLWRLRWFYRRKWGLPDDTPDDKPILRNGTWKW